MSLSGVTSSSTSPPTSPSEGALELAEELSAPLRRFADSLVSAWEDGLPGCCPGVLATEFARMEEEVSSPPGGVPNGSGGEGAAILPLQAPGLRLENKVFRSDTFSRLHVEVAVSGQGLQVVHFTMMPEVGEGQKGLPVVLAGDLVGYRDVVSFAILDPTPVAVHRQMPAAYDEAVARLQAAHFGERCPAIRDGCVDVLPEWGRRIFGARCVCLRRQDFVKERRETEFEELMAGFLSYAEELVALHCAWQDAGAERADASVLRDYCAAQRENEMTVQVLEKCFGRDVAVRYMADVMFPEPSGPVQG